MLHVQEDDTTLLNFKSNLNSMITTHKLSSMSRSRVRQIQHLPLLPMCYLHWEILSNEPNNNPGDCRFFVPDLTSSSSELLDFSA